MDPGEKRIRQEDCNEDTLGVGIFTTLFSVYFIARLLTSIYVTKNKHKEKLI